MAGAGRRSLTDRFLLVAERGGNLLPQPVTLFALLAVAVIFGFALASWLGLSAIYFMAVSNFVGAYAGTWVTERSVEPRLGAYDGPERPEGESDRVESAEKRAAGSRSPHVLRPARAQER